MVYISVRGVQYSLDQNKNAKIPEGFFHKLSFDVHRSEFEHFSGHLINFLSYGIFEIISAITRLSIEILGNFVTKPLTSK